MISFSSHGMPFSHKRKIQQQSDLIYWLNTIAKRKPTFSLIKGIHYDKCEIATYEIIFQGLTDEGGSLFCLPYMVFERDRDVKENQVGFVAISGNAQDVWTEYCRGLNLYLPLVRPSLEFTTEELATIQGQAQQTLFELARIAEIEPDSLVELSFDPKPQWHWVAEYNDWFSGALEVTGVAPNIPAIEELANDNRPQA